MLNVWSYLTVLAIFSICYAQAIPIPNGTIPPSCPATTYDQTLSADGTTVTFTPTIGVTGTTLVASTTGGDISSPMIPTGPNFTTVPTPFTFTSGTGTILSYSFNFMSTTGITCSTNRITPPETTCPNLTFTQEFDNNQFAFNRGLGDISSVDVSASTTIMGDVTFGLAPNFATMPTSFTTTIPPDLGVTSYTFSFTTTTGIQCETQTFIPSGYQGMVGQTAGSFRLGTARNTFSITPSRYQRTKRRIEIMYSQ